MSGQGEAGVNERFKEERCDVDFVDDRSGKRWTIVDNAGRIAHFPGIERNVWMESPESEQYLQPVVRFRAEFQ